MRRNPFGAETAAASGGPLQYFTNREQDLEAFERHLQASNAEDMQVLVFYGVGGTGKTTLVQKLCVGLDSAQPPVPYARFNLDNIADQTQAYREVLLRLRADLENNFHIDFPRFDLGLAVILARDGGTPPPMVKVNPHLSSVFDAALEFTPSFLKATTRLLETELKQVIRKSDKLEQWVRHVGGTEEVVALGQALMQDEQIIQDELIRRFAQDLAANLPKHPGKACRGALFLDTYEALWTGRESGQSAQARLLDGWVRGLAEFCLASGILLVITGRDRLSWDSDPDWEGCLDQHLLGGVSAHDAQDFLCRRGIGPPPSVAAEPLQRAILHCADAGAALPSCHLLTLALCADIVLNTRLAGGQDPPPQMFSTIPTAQVAGALATRFLKSLHSRNLELWVEALSLTPRFDETAALMLDSDRLYHNGRAGWEQIVQYSFIAPESNGFYRIHRTMREALRARQRPETLREQNAWFQRHWQGRGENALGFYHHWSEDPAAALSEWVAQHQEWITTAQISEARSLLTVWTEIGLDNDDRSLLSDSDWAATHLALGQALWKTPSTPRQTILSRAAEHYQAALTVYTEDTAPERWADAQMGLALCLLSLPTGDRTEHLYQAMSLLQDALGTYTAEGNPEAWSAAQNHLGIVFARLPDGDEAENQRKALACFEAAVQVWTETEHPKIWARGQHNLGVTYLELPDGEVAENLHQALGFFEAALRVRTEEAFPSGWALTQFNLGETCVALAGLPIENGQERLHEGIQHFEAALRVYTQADFPEFWAEAHNSLGCAWQQMPGTPSDPLALDTLHRAVSFHQATLEVWNEADYPGDWAKAQQNLAETWQILASRTGASEAWDASRIACLAARQGFTAVGLTEKADACTRALEALTL
jgi:tetratricopeptide (TPR) repeat protein